jgi:hypothetical protein
MRERLGKIAELPLCPGIVLLGEKANVVPQLEEALKQFSRLTSSPHELQTIRQPKGAGQKHAF